MIELSYACGLRVSELVNLKLNSIYFEESYIQVTGKGQKDRLIPINKSTLIIIDEYIKTERLKYNIDDNHLFLSQHRKFLTRQRIWQIIKKHIKNAGIIKKYFSSYIKALICNSSFRKWRNIKSNSRNVRAFKYINN